jgi:hypothetical protein
VLPKKKKESKTCTFKSITVHKTFLFCWFPCGSYIRIQL